MSKTTRIAACPFADTYENLRKDNPILRNGQRVYVTDKKQWYTGDGQTPFNDLQPESLGGDLSGYQTIENSSDNYSDSELFKENGYLSQVGAFNLYTEIIAERLSPISEDIEELNKKITTFEELPNLLDAISTSVSWAHERSKTDGANRYYNTILDFLNETQVDNPDGPGPDIYTEPAFATMMLPKGSIITIATKSIPNLQVLEINSDGFTSDLANIEQTEENLASQINDLLNTNGCFYTKWIKFGKFCDESSGGSEILQEELERLQYYGDKDIIPSDENLFEFTVINDETVSIVLSQDIDKDSITELVIPYKYIDDEKEYKITSIGNIAFFGCENLTSITIPNGVTSIGDYVFEQCSNLTSITIPNSVTSIGEGALSYCENLTSITIPNSVTSIGNSVFNCCSNLTSVVIPNGVTSIGNSAFFVCENLTSITIPNSVTSIGDSVFNCCSNLTSVVIPNGVTSIGNSVFFGCENLTSITIPNSVTSIGEGAFDNCSEDFTIICNSGSYAETYAKENGIKYAYNYVNSEDLGGGDNDNSFVLTGDVSVDESGNPCLVNMNATFEETGNEFLRGKNIYCKVPFNNQITFAPLVVAQENAMIFDAVVDSTNISGYFYSNNEFEIKMRYIGEFEPNLDGITQYSMDTYPSTYAVHDYIQIKLRDYYNKEYIDSISGRVSLKEDIGNKILDEEKDETSKDAKYYSANATDTKIDTKIAEGLNNIVAKTTEEKEHAVYGEELVTTDGWITEGWSGNLTDGFTHISGNTSSLSFNIPGASDGDLYQVSFGPYDVLSTNDLMIRIGGSDLLDASDLYDPHAIISVGIRTISGGLLEFIPESSFVGSITNISIKKIIGECQGSYTIYDSTGTESFALRTTKSYLSEMTNDYKGQNNLFLGAKSGALNTVGHRNVALGSGALRNNTSGSRNVALGYITLEDNINGSDNIGIGSKALANNVIGNNVAIGSGSQYTSKKAECNVSIGNDTLFSNYDHKCNVALGHQAMCHASPDMGVALGYQSSYNDSGKNNVSLGAFALYYKKAGNNNIAIGYEAGKGMEIDNSTIDNNILIGYQAGTTLQYFSANNTMVGYRAGYNVTKGSNNILIGANVTTDNPTDSNVLKIGNLIQGSMLSTNKYIDIDGDLKIKGLDILDAEGKIPEDRISNMFYLDGDNLKINIGGKTFTLTPDNE